MKTKPGLLILGLGLLLTLSCSKYPPSSERLLEDLAVITQYDTKIDFNNYHTFTMATSIVKITNRDTTNVSDATATAILDQISKNMEARGFIKAITPVVPDFGVQVVYFQNTTVYTYYYDWWGYYPSWYYYYPYYPVYYSSYTTGLANIELVDLKVVDQNKKQLYLRWNGYIRGLLTGDHTTAEILRCVDQAFIQTPQLKTTAN
ncbi:MAG: DUF4136 domain-containing protein [Alphaproteobacteria bacterium]|nr:DUF4136 domain-containing protein [Alphaproteobacteria bacterium]